MKTLSFIASIAGLLVMAVPALAEPVNGTIERDQPVANTDALLKQVSQDVASKPKQAGEIVKQAILNAKADKVLVAQIVQVAVLAAPEQAEVIRKYALAVAPDAEKEVTAMIAAVLMGDQVAGKYADVESDKYSDVEKDTADAGDEPEGSDPENNTVWLTNHGSLRQGGNPNPLSSKTPNTSDSPNSNHNRGGVTEGGGTVIVDPTSPTGP